MPQPRRAAAPAEKLVPALSNRGYFSEYYLTHRLDSGLADVYSQWDELDKQGAANERTRIRSLGSAFGAHRADAAVTAPDADALDNDTLASTGLAPDARDALLALNDAILAALGWTPQRGRDPLVLTTGEKTLVIPAAHVAETASGTLLVALDTVFATDPATVVATRTAPSGQLVDPLTLNDKAAAVTALQAAQLIFTADEPPLYILFVSGGSITLLDRERWGEGVSLGANLDDALARGDAKPKGELAAIAALFGAATIDPGDQAQSVLTSLLEKASSESAGVSKELRHGIRRSVELLANAVVRDRRERSNLAWTSLDPKDLTRQSLRYLYRIIVLLFAEARPELGILPVDDPDYQAGYSVGRLREVALTDLQTPNGQRARHIQQSLDVLFGLVDQGHHPEQGSLGEDTRELVFPGLKSTLFDERSCDLLDKAHLYDETLQEVIQHLCFSRERAGRGRQPVSYSTLGINQLGAVYEGLMAYSGFLATEPLYEIDKDGDPDNGSWVIPVTRADEFPEDVFLKEPTADGGERRVRYEEGDFVFRLSGRDRQRSASFYTPEVLTEFTVRHALDVLFEENPDLKAKDILELTVCEPALGSGAFLTEAVKQLAECYLKAAQDETGEVIDADQYQLQLQRAKAHFAVNQAYGVDLNQTAVELAEVSLWLACMHDGLQAPWFGARLRRGNSLIGARRETYTREQVLVAAWAGKTATAPTARPISETPLGTANGIHHFLVPGQGWGAAADAKEIKELDPAWVEKVKAWRKAIHKKPTPRQVDRLDALAVRVEEAWAESAAEVERFWKATRQHLDVWGTETPSAGDRFGEDAIRTVLSDERSATSRLRSLMDAWCSLWLWAPQHGIDLPTLDGWLTVAEGLLHSDERWDVDALFTDERELPVPAASSLEDIEKAHGWLASTREIAVAQGWFHWELEFAPVFVRGGFDLQVGNPPWVRPRWSDEDALAEHEPWFGVTEPIPEKQRSLRREAVLAVPAARAQYVAERAENAAIGEALGAASREPQLAGQQNNLYLPFITGAWRRGSRTGTTALLHPDGFLSDPKAGPLRQEAYRRFRMHLHFVNTLRLFREIKDSRPYCVNLYGGPQPAVDFRQMSLLFHPQTVDLSLKHSGGGEDPGRKLTSGEWDLRPHASRVVRVREATLRDWAAVLGEDDWRSVPIVKTVTSAETSAVQALASHPTHLSALPLHWAPGWHEMTAPREGLIEWRTERPRHVADVIFQGPHIGLASPWTREANEGCSGPHDYRLLADSDLSSGQFPRTNWQRSCSTAEFADRLPSWDGSPNTEYWRVAVRKMLPMDTVRSLFPAVIPPGPSVSGSLSVAALETPRSTLLLAGVLASLPLDYFVRIVGMTNLEVGLARRFPVPRLDDPLSDAIVHRAARLNCVTERYADLWQECWRQEWSDDPTAIASAPTVSSSPDWSPGSRAHHEHQRWALLTELDALVALALGISARSVAALYNAQFPVLVGYEAEMVFDSQGHQLCAYRQQHGLVQSKLEGEAKATKARNWTKVWDRVQRYRAGETATDLGPFLPPFKPADRVQAISNAYWTFVDRYDLSPIDLAERPT